MGLCLIGVALDWTLLLVILKVAIGLGMVIFVHELGHFVVAKLCGVQCDKFYLGFDIAGLKLCKFRWGETEYGIGILPLGGYVKMLGQEDNPARLREELERAKASCSAQSESAGSTETTPGAETPSSTPGNQPVDIDAAEQALYSPRSYLAKSVPKRMAIISAGVIMNLLFAFLIAAVAYRMGVQQVVCRVGEVIPGEAAWRADIQPGDQIVEINGRKVYQYGELKANISLGDVEQGVSMVIRRPGQTKEIAVHVIPELSTKRLMPTIGISPPQTTTVDGRPGGAVVLSGSPAADAKPPFQAGDKIVEINGVPVSNDVQLDAQLVADAAKPLAVTVLRPAASEGAEAETAGQQPQRMVIHVPTNPMRRLGLVMEMGPIVAIQDHSPAAAAGIRPGDRILKIDGQPVGDPMTLPSRLRVRAGQTIRLTLSRKDAKEPANISVPLRRVDWLERPLLEGNPMSIPELGLAYEVPARIESVLPDSAAAKAGLKPGDVVHSAKILPPEDGADQEEVAVRFGLDSPNWPYFLYAIQERLPDSPVQLTLEDKRTVTLVPQADPQWFNPQRGFSAFLDLDTFVRTAGTWNEALALGVRETMDAASQVLLFLRGLGTQISPRALAGPLMIVKFAGMSAYAGTSQLLMFLCLLSANLAVLNFLPIPVLDGGHFVFLLYEGIRGKPADERVQLALSYLGLLFILVLMAWLIGLDFGLIARE